MMFSVRIVNAAGPVGRGAICIGVLKENFEMSFEYWSPEEYEQQWSKALKRVALDGCTSALITSLTDPNTANFVSWWPAYRDGESVVFQNGILLLGDLDTPFALTRYEEVVPVREHLSEDGEQISEWCIPVSEVRAFIAEAR